MQIADLQRLYDYHYWANRKLLTALAQLSPDQLAAPLAGSYGSIRNTLVHALSAEWGWLDRCGGPARGAPLKAEQYPTLAELHEAWAKVEGYMRAFLSALGDADLARPVSFALGSGPTHQMALGDLLHHAAIHAVHHRGQAALLARMQGCTPGNFDLLIFLDDASAGRQVRPGRE
jgi:uncharacterized damage-inducible protein DinB